jgi:hypothetical protein
VVWAVAKGSMLNKAILVPAALPARRRMLSAQAPSAGILLRRRDQRAGTIGMMIGYTD